MPDHTTYDRSGINKTRRGWRRGAFKQLLIEHPDIREQLVRQYVRSKSPERPRITLAEIHRLFVRALRMKGITNDSYPFNTLDIGYRALCRHLRSQDRLLIKRHQIRPR